MAQPFVQFEFLGDTSHSPRRLRYTHNDLADMEDEAGCGFQALLNTSFRGLRLLLKYGLKWQDRALTNQQVGNLIQKHVEKGGTQVDLLKKVIEALQEAGFLEKEAPPDADAAGVEGNALAG